MSTALSQGDVFLPIPLERTRLNRSHEEKSHEEKSHEEKSHEEKSQDALDRRREHNFNCAAALRHFDSSTSQLQQRSWCSDPRFSSSGAHPDLEQNARAATEASIQNILNTSDALFFNFDGKDERSHGIFNKFRNPIAPACSRTKVSIPSSFYFEEERLADLPITYQGHELPVAAALIKYVDLVSGDSPNSSNSKKRRAQVQEPQEDEEVVTGQELDSLDNRDLVGDAPRSSSVVSSVEDQWSERFHELCKYQQQKGHCSVPHNFDENPPLARWVKRQRHQYKPFKDGTDNSSHQWPQLVQERIQALDSIGFVWDCQGAAWDEKFIELQDYKAQHLDCNVPSNFFANPALAMWVKCQRRQYKMYRQGLKSGMTVERVQLLENIGFSWELRKPQKRVCN